MQHRDEQEMLFYLLNTLDFKQSLEQVTTEAALKMGDYRFENLAWDEMEAAVIGVWLALRKSKVKR